MNITVTAPDRTYDVVIDRGCMEEFFVRIEGFTDRRIALLLPEVLTQSFASEVQRLRSMPHLVLIPVPDGEVAKSAKVLEKCWQLLGAHTFTRNDFVVGMGGGSTTDLAGFVAASWLRGIEWIAVPTTLAGMVDAAIGGKTGINTADGKNLVGAFHSPSTVYCDANFLDTLPARDISAGLAEVVKCGFISDPQILVIAEEIGSDPSLLMTHLDELVRRAIAVKAGIVSQDFKESGVRESLNYGHTLGHAIEKIENFRMRHGEAVAIGMVFAAEIAAAAKLISPAEVEMHRRILSRLNLPTSHSGDWNALRRAMSVDKKSRGDHLRFVVLDGIGKTTRLVNPNESLLEAAYDRMRT